MSSSSVTFWCGRARSIAVALSALLAVAVAGPGAAQPADSDAGPIMDNYYAAGQRIRVTAPVEGDVVVAGREIAITEFVAGDVLAAGWRIAFTGETPDDVRMVGGTVVVDGLVNGDLTVAGGTVTTGPAAHVAGRAWLTGQTVEANGIYERALQVAGGTVRIGGELRQPARIVAEKLEILSTARVLAPLSYKSPVEATVAPGATLAVPMSYERIPAREAREAHAFIGISTILFTGHLLVGGLLMMFALPRATSNVVETLRAAPGRSLLVGLVLLIALPPAALALLLTVFGIPVGLALMALFFVALFAGVVATAFWVGDLEARWFKVRRIRTRRQQAAMLLAGIVTLAVLRALPVVGGLVVFLSVLVGTGALMLWAYRVYAVRSAATPA